MGRLGSNGFDINKIRVASPCSDPWESMEGNERARRCNSCDLSVYNVAGMSRAEIEELVTNRRTRLCIRLFRRSDGTVVTRDCPEGVRNYRRRVTHFAAAVFASVLGLLSVSYGQKDEKNSNHSKQVKIERSRLDRLESEFTGVLVDPNGALI